MELQILAHPGTLEGLFWALVEWVSDLLIYWPTDWMNILYQVVLHHIPDFPTCTTRALALPNFDFFILFEFLFSFLLPTVFVQFLDYLCGISLLVSLLHHAISNTVVFLIKFCRKSYISELPTWEARLVFLFPPQLCFPFTNPYSDSILAEATASSLIPWTPCIACQVILHVNLPGLFLGLGKTPSPWDSSLHLISFQYFFQLQEVYLFQPSKHPDCLKTDKIEWIWVE